MTKVFKWKFEAGFAPLMKTLQLPRDTYDKFVIISIDQLRNTVENAVLDNAHDSEL